MRPSISRLLTPGPCRTRLFERHPRSWFSTWSIRPVDKGRHRERRLVLPRLVIGKANAVAQFAEPDFPAADLGHIGAADAAEGGAGHVAEREGHADKPDERERKEFADRRNAADGGNHGAGNLSAERGDAVARSLEARRQRIKARKGVFAGS